MWIPIPTSWWSWPLRVGTWRGSARFAAPVPIDKAEADWTALQVFHQQDSSTLNDVVGFHAQQCILMDPSTGAVLARHPGFDTSTEDVQELVVIGAEWREALLRCLREGSESTGP